MRKIGDLMHELGFNKDAPDSVKKAFIKNLIKEAYGAPVEQLHPKGQSQTQAKSKKSVKSPTASTQLSFELDNNDKDIA